jgi:two-component system, NtrC family, sensor histidine kinase PilS
MTPQDADRRGRDRRSGDRRGADSRRQGDVPARRAEDAFSSDLFFDPGWLAAGDAASDSRSLPADDQRSAPAAMRSRRVHDNAFARVFRTYAAARAAVGLGLVAAQGVGALLGSRGGDSLALVSMLYAAQAILLWLLPRWGGLAPGDMRSWAATGAPAAHRHRQWWTTIGVDLLAFTFLHVLESGTAFNYGALLVLPVLMAGVLSSRLLALATASAVALMLLAVTWHASLGRADASTVMVQAGLAGLGMFVITLLAGELAGRLAREQLAARDSRELARQQAQLNRLVIEEMADGVLVIDRALQVRAANPAARALLVDQGLSPPAPFNFQHLPAWAALHQATQRALATGHWSEAGEDVLLAFGQGHTRTLRLRVRFMRARGLERGVGAVREGDAAAPRPAESGDAVEPFAVLLLEDLRTLQARIRQDKLAAMGRVSAGIAHEIRNPLAAIAQANDLLLEDDLPAPQQRLAQMVADNVQRLKRLVDDVMELAPGGESFSPCIDANAAVAEICADWARTAQLSLGADSRLRTELPAPLSKLEVLFDPEHLRRVLVNLLDNAHRHAGPIDSSAPGAIFLRLMGRDDGTVMLSVLSDGAPIAPEVERYLFEPFFSTRSRGSGLGLYICRELCERHGASIEYRPRPAAERLRNEFFVSLRRAAGDASSR